eukprot:scaffold619_cov403-Prasinococcus_capsulatus_cf.AAC.5
MLLEEAASNERWALGRLSGRGVEATHLLSRRKIGLGRTSESQPSQAPCGRQGGSVSQSQGSLSLGAHSSPAPRLHPCRGSGRSDKMVKTAKITAGQDRLTTSLLGPAACKGKDGRSFFLFSGCAGRRLRAHCGGGLLPLFCLAGPSPRGCEGGRIPAARPRKLQRGARRTGPPPEPYSGVQMID